MEELRRNPEPAASRPTLRQVPQGLLAVGMVAGLALAVVLGVAAFTRFDPHVPSEDSPREVRRWNEQAFDDAFQSVALGVGCSFSLLAAFACGQAWRKRRKATQ